MIVIHSGMVKTAMTSLQQQVFARHPKITYLGMPAPTATAKLAINQICQADSVVYDEIAVAEQLRTPAIAAGTSTVVLSYENFALYESTDKGVVAERLHNLFPEARILFTIRRQQDLLTAWYLQKLQKYVRHGHFMCFEDWFAMKRRQTRRTILDDLRFDQTIAHYSSVFGAERVRVLMFEQLRTDPSAFSRDLGEILGISGPSIESLLSERHLNPTVPASLLTVGKHLFPIIPRRLARKIGKPLLRMRGSAAKVVINDAISSQIAALVAPGNRYLVDTYQLPLAAHGYSL